ncbi:MAG: DoxX family protein [Pseudomonadota bacterium]
MIRPLVSLHNAVFNAIQTHLAGWLPGLMARFTFAAVLMVYYLNSATTKVGEGLAGFFSVQDGAYFQMLPKVVELYDYDASQIPVVPYQLIVYAGTYAEFILPVLIVVGLFTRLAAVGMIGFVFVQSIVDITGHHADAETIGAWFDRFSDATILDQRAMWVFLLLYLVVYGAGKLSLDHLLGRRHD